MPGCRDQLETLDAAYARSDRIVARRIASEFVLVPLAGRGANLDTIYSLNRVGTFIWDNLDGKTTGHAIVAALCSKFDVSAAEAGTDFREFIATLLEIKAITPCGDPATLTASLRAE